MDDPHLQRLERELDYAVAQSRRLREQLAATAGAPPSDELGAARKRRLHKILDAIQRLTPEFLRRLVRGPYLKYFYYRLYPEHSPRALLAPADAPLDARSAHSGYAPFLEFKRRLCGGLCMDLSGIAIDCEPGLVSVILPVHNGAQYLAEAMDSVLRQSYRTLELIVVDDGSTDDTPRILEHYAGESRVRTLRQENRKLPAALNTGFARARGEFQTWVSADNRMHPEMLARLAAFLRSRHDVEMVYADEELIDGSGGIAAGSDFCRELQSPPGSHRLRRPRDPGELNFIQNNFIGACFLYRAWAARIAGEYSERCFGLEDYDYWMRMNALFRLAHLGTAEILHSYRLHRGSLTAREEELAIAARARYFMPVEAERRRFFAGGFDITLRGRHPWFGVLARAWRQAGHNLMEIPEDTAEARYRFETTRAFPKSIALSAEAGDGFVLRGNRLIADSVELVARDASSLEYPLLALANAKLWAANQI